MKKRVCVQVLVLALMIIASLTTGQGAEIERADTVTIDMQIESGMTIRKTASDSLIEFIQADLAFFPMEKPTQKVLRMQTEPEAEEKEGKISFRWEAPEGEDLTFKVDARVMTNNKLVKVETTDFPVETPEKLEEYARPSNNIDSDDPAIVKRASEIAEGETDLYAVVFKTAEWTSGNINYNLSTLTAEVSNKASWVLENRQGVCDEITTLFIALLRAVGVPAKFVSGVAYTDSPLFPRNWGAHGWAEVYFPESGWVPFDVTYGQYGWIDATHVKCQENIDSAASSLKYEWLGRSIDVETKPIKVEAETFTYSGKAKDLVDLGIEAIQGKTGIGSYNLIGVEIENQVDSYVSTMVRLARLEELEVVGEETKSIYLKPGQKKKIYWLVKVDEQLDRNYVYTFPVAVGNIFNTTAKTMFQVIPDATVFTQEEMREVKKAMEQEEKKIYSKEVRITCEQEKGFYYEYEKARLTCKAKNKGNVGFENLEFCFEKECEKADLAIAQEKSFSYESEGEEGINKISFYVRGEDVAKTEFYDLEILDKPDIETMNYTYPEEIEFQQPYKFEFTLKKASSSEPQNVTLILDVAGREKKLSIDELTADKRYVFNLNSEDLGIKPNRIRVEGEYYDKNRKKYGFKDEKTIDLVNVTFTQRLNIWLRQLDLKIRNLFK